MFLRGIKLSIPIVLISHSYFKVSKTIRINTIHYFIIKTPNEIELQQIVLNHLSDFKFKDSMNLYKDYTKEPLSTLVNDTTLS